MTAKDKIKTAESIVSNGFAGRVWCKDSESDTAAVRIYAANGNGYIDITDTGANVNGVKRASFAAAKAACAAANVNATR